MRNKFTKRLLEGRVFPPVLIEIICSNKYVTMKKKMTVDPRAIYNLSLAS